MIRVRLRGMPPQGYTVVEVMIFLAVSGALLISALSLIGGQQNKTEFAQASRDAESKIRDIINDVSTGFYPNNGRIKCDPAAGGGITLTQSTSVPQGENAGCIFIGRLLQFAPDGNERALRVYSVAGQRLNGSREVENLQTARGQVIARSPQQTTAPDDYEDFDLGPIRIGRVSYSGNSIGGFGVFTTFNRYRGNVLESGSTSADIAALPGTSLNQSSWDFADDVNDTIATPALPINPNDGVTVCLIGEATNRYALITIGGSSRQLTTNLSIHNVRADGSSC